MTLLLDIQREKHTTMLFISHDLALVRHVADKVVVMYLGKVMEQGTVEEVFGGGYHPYTEALLSAIRSPNPDETRRERIRLGGETPSPINVPSGLPFRHALPSQGRCNVRYRRSAFAATVADA